MSDSYEKYHRKRRRYDTCLAIFLIMYLLVYFIVLLLPFVHWMLIQR